jgi:hypothetical protein
MIVVKLMGGLGNQMFQYAAGLSAAERLRTELKMDLSWFDSLEEVDTPRFYELDNFNLKQEFVNKNDFVLKNDGFKNRLMNIRKKQLNFYKESQFNYSDNFLNIKNNTYIEGYFQTEKYFNDIRDDVIYSFTFKNKASVKSAKIIDQIKNSDSVSLHVRRGDYVSNKSANKFHGLMGEAYYKKAIALINKKIKNPKYFIFSDEIEWVKNSFDLPKNSVYITHNKSGIEDMRIMIECKHNIIANSSFSWWGAWLGLQKDKVVIAPKLWFLDSNTNTSDVIPERWSQI